MESDLETSVVDWLIDHPGAEALFKEWGIDMGCAGKSLGWAAEQRGLDPHWLLSQLDERLGIERRSASSRRATPVPPVEQRPMHEEERFDLARLMELYRSGPQLVRESIAGMTDEELDARPVPGLWSSRQVVCHIADFEVVYADRMKRALAEFEPTVFGGDPDTFAASLGYLKRPVEGELLVIEGVRRQMEAILESLSPRDLGRNVRHSEAGLVPLGQLLSNIAAHIPHHVAFIDEKRRRLA